MTTHTGTNFFKILQGFSNFCKTQHVLYFLNAGGSRISNDIPVCHGGHKGHEGHEGNEDIFSYLISLNFSTFLLISLHFIRFHCISLRFFTFLYIFLYFSAFLYISLHLYITFTFHFDSVFNIQNRTRQCFCMNYIDHACMHKFLQNPSRFFKFL